MNIVFLSEQQFIGKISRDHKNMRTEYGWMNMLDAYHLPYKEILEGNSICESIIENSDLIVLIPSKKHPEFLRVAFAFKDKNLAIMQEGPNHLWQDWPMEYQLMYLAIIKQQAKIVFVHNEKDARYFAGITKKPIMVLRTVLHTKDFENTTHSNRINKVFIGGNMCSWYGGMNSYLAVMNNKSITDIGFPSMGRKQTSEETTMMQLDSRISYMPYLQWDEFMMRLNEYGIVVHLMPTAAAGSLSLNAAMLGIPCIGNKDDDTQRILFPKLSIDVTRVDHARELVNKLLTDESFYNEVVTEALNSLKLFDIEEQKQNYITRIQELLNG